MGAASSVSRVETLELSCSNQQSANCPQSDRSEQITRENGRSAYHFIRCSSGDAKTGQSSTILVWSTMEKHNTHTRKFPNLFKRPLWHFNMRVSAVLPYEDNQIETSVTNKSLQLYKAQKSEPRLQECFLKPCVFYLWNRVVAMWGYTPEKWGTILSKYSTIPYSHTILQHGHSWYRLAYFYSTFECLGGRLEYQKPTRGKHPAV